MSIRQLTPTEVAQLGVLIKKTRNSMGSQYPNPCVGAMILVDDRVIAEGFHIKAGDAHAEIIAIQSAGERAKGSTLLITLEPCSRKGRTDPCVRHIVEAGISRVIWAVNDPNPIMSQRAKAILEARNIQVVDDVMPKEGRSIIREFDMFHREGRPYVYVKSAMSLDGYIAPNSDRLTYISSPESLAVVQRLRTFVQAICVGERTIRIDQPQLSIRMDRPINTQPMIAVVDPHNQLNQLWMEQTLKMGRRLVWFRSTTTTISHENLMVYDGLTANKDYNWRYILKSLYLEGVHGVLVEGGRGIFHSILSAGLFDEFWVTKVPQLLTGDQAVPFISHAMDEPLMLDVTSVKAYGPDVLIKYKNRHVFQL